MWQVCAMDECREESRRQRELLRTLCAASTGPCLHFLSIDFKRMRWPLRDNNSSIGASPSSHFRLCLQEGHD